MKKLLDLVIYTSVLFGLLVSLTSSFHGAARASRDDDDNGQTQMAVTAEKILNLQAQMKEIRDARLQDRLAMVESSVSEIKWMLRSVIGAIVGELFRRLFRIVSARIVASPIKLDNTE